jgi:hypothetical protein
MRMIGRRAGRAAARERQHDEADRRRAVERIERRRRFRMRMVGAAGGLLVLYPTVVWLLGVGERVWAAYREQPIPEARIQREMRRRSFLAVR